jgi:hypothetical protein
MAAASASSAAKERSGRGKKQVMAIG